MKKDYSLKQIANTMSKVEVDHWIIDQGLQKN